MKSKEKKYKIISTSAVVLETVLNPALKHSHGVMLEGSKDLHNSIDDFFSTLKSSVPKPIKWLLYPFSAINKSTQSITNYIIRSEYQSKSQCLKIIESSLNEKQKNLESLFEKSDFSYKSWAFSNENRKLIKDVAFFIKANTPEFSDLPYNRVLQYFYAFYKTQAVARQKLWKIAKNEPDDLYKSGICMLDKFSKYAVGIYGKFLMIMILKKWYKIFTSETDEEVFMRYTETSREDLVYTQLKSQKYLPAHAIVLNKAEKSIVLAIRGTVSVFDCLSDLKGDYIAHDYTDCNTGDLIATGLVHAGMMISAKNLSNEVKKKILNLLSENPDYSLFITGHSLGAGVTALLALLWMSDQEIMNKGFLALAYAPPAVLSEELNCYLKENLFSCSYGNDVVCRMSLGSLRDLVEVVKYFRDKEKKQDKIRAGNIVSSSLFKGKMSQEVLLNVYKDIKDRMNNYKLEAPGKIIQIYSKKKHEDFNLLEGSKLFEASFVEPKYYQELVLNRSSFLDHYPNLYQEALRFLAGS